MRPRLDLLTRLAGVTGVSPANLVKLFEAWPAANILDFHCITASRVVKHGASTTTTARAMVEGALGEPLSPNWRLRKLCPSPDCAQPNHYTLEALQRPPFSPLPARLFRAEIDAFVSAADPDDDVLGAIESLDDPRAAVDELGHLYDPAQVERLLQEHFAYLL